MHSQILVVEPRASPSSSQSSDRAQKQTRTDDSFCDDEFVTLPGVMEEISQLTQDVGQMDGKPSVATTPSSTMTTTDTHAETIKPMARTDLAVQQTSTTDVSLDPKRHTYSGN